MIHDIFVNCSFTRPKCAVLFTEWKELNLLKFRAQMKWFFTKHNQNWNEKCKNLGFLGKTTDNETL